MPLNKSKGNMYPFITDTWNTVKGACPHECTYCYMKRKGPQRPVRFDERELNTDLGAGGFIFVGSSCDIFADDIPDQWILKTIKHMSKYQNGYLLQTKNPERFLKDYSDISWSDMNLVICTTIETNRWIQDVMRNSPPPMRRAQAMKALRECGFKTYVTIEPIMAFDLPQIIQMIKECNPAQVNIGADSGNNNLPEPTKRDLVALIHELGKFTKIVQKQNLWRLLK